MIASRPGCEARPPVSRETIQIRLAQPPIYLMGAVVLASLLPLFAQLFGGAASDGVERLRRLAFAGMNVPQLEPREPSVVALAVDEENEQVEEELVEEDEIEFFELVPLDDTEPERATRPSVVSRAKAACARKDKDSARAAYRALERGDKRRKTIRRACRNAGVWFL